mmetsp:Transcript_58727/g.102269  ORF Transcript_58727/g.102269 Transcript_58727/m.102269 type:complete len:1021 (-) Transcript_58727:205-3267(-)
MSLSIDVMSESGENSKHFDSVLTHVIETLGELAIQHQEEIEKLRSENVRLRAKHEERGSSKPCVESTVVSIDVTSSEQEQESAELLPAVWPEPRLSEPNDHILVEFPHELEYRPSPTLESGERDGSANTKSISFADSSDKSVFADSTTLIKVPRRQTSASMSASRSWDKPRRQTSDTVCTEEGFEYRVYAVRRPWSENLDMDRLKLTDIYGCTRRHRGTRVSATAHRFSGLLEFQADQAENWIWGFLSMFVMSPDSNFRAAWVITCLTVLCYDIVMLPVEVSFDLEHSDTREIMNVVFVIFWTVDLPMNFFTGIETPAQVDIRPHTTCGAYFRGWFGFDLFLVIQDWLGVAIRTSSDLSSLSLGKGVRLAQVMRFVRLTRLLRIFKKRPMFKVILLRCGVNFDGVNATYLWTYLLALLLISIHIQTCLWHAAGNIFDDGWVTSNDLGSTGTFRRYVISLHWTCSRLIGMATKYRFTCTAERLVESGMIIWSLVTTFTFSGQLTAMILALLTSQNYSLRKLGHTYVCRHGISLALYNRLMKFLKASQLGGNARALMEEAKLLKELPPVLREDLIYEARMLIVRKKQLFDDMWFKNPRVIRNVCNQAMSVLIAIEDETLFAEGDAANRMLFITSGVLRYKCRESLSTIGTGSSVQSAMDGNPTVRYGSFMPSLPGIESITRRASAKFSFVSNDTCVHYRSSSGQASLFQNSSISEACLWTTWEHLGSLVASEESLLLALDAHLFSNVILQHHEACVHAVKYAKRYVWHLNQFPGTISDIINMPNLHWRTLDTELFKGGDEDHYVFISHYKVEAGTEATLLRDQFEVALQDDPHHPAHQFLSPFFIDSEDLDDLARLKAHVMKSTALVLLLTPGVLSRPWCLLELVTAVRMGVFIVPVEVQRPGCGYQYPDEDFYERLLNGQIVSSEGVSLLESEGIEMQEVERVIRQVFKKIAVSFSPHKTKTVRKAEIHHILKRCSNAADDAMSVFQKMSTLTTNADTKDSGNSSKGSSGIPGWRGMFGSK